MTSATDDAQTETPEAEKPRELNLGVKVTDSGPCRKHIAITVPRADIDWFYEQELDGLIDSAVVPGFRAGHVPQKLVERRFKKELGDQVRQKILVQSLDQVARDQKIDPINEPEIDVENLVIPEEGDFEYEFSVEVRPQFDLPNYKGLSIKRPVRDISDADVARAQDRFLMQYGTLTEREGAAQAGDWIQISGEFKREGRPIGSFPRTGVRILPKLRFQDAELDGFDKLMIGVTKGETRETQVVVSSEATNLELRGEKVDVTFHVHDVMVRKVPELDTRFLTRLGFESEEELKDAVKSALERQLKHEQRQSARRQVVEQITESATWELPEGAVRRQVENAMRRDILEMQQAGYTMQEIRSRENALRQQAISSTRQALKEHFVLDKIATAEEIAVTESDLEHEIRVMAEQMGENPRRVRARMRRSGMIENLEAEVRERKAIDLIFDAATYTDVPTPAKHDDDTEAVSVSVCGDTAAPVAAESTEEGDEE